VRLVKGGNYSWDRVGYSRPLAPREEVPFAFVEDGTVVVEVSPKDIRYTPAERAAGRARVPRVVFPGYPIRIEEDTVFVGTHFLQRDPHTAIFEIVTGARLVFRGNCDCVNVTLPDEVAPGDFTGNNAQGTAVETGNPDRPTVFLLCECEKCSTFQTSLVETIRSGAWDAGATIIDVKAAARLRRDRPLDIEADVQRQVTENAAALADRQKVRAASRVG
jgi:hypothetical protein